jgi:hypothetical protein
VHLLFVIVLLNKVLLASLPACLCLPRSCPATKEVCAAQISLFLAAPLSTRMSSLAPSTGELSVPISHLMCCSWTRAYPGMGSELPWSGPQRTCLGVHGCFSKSIALCAHLSFDVLLKIHDACFSGHGKSELPWSGGRSGLV